MVVRNVFALENAPARLQHMLTNCSVLRVVGSSFSW